MSSDHISHVLSHTWAVPLLDLFIVAFKGQSQVWLLFYACCQYIPVKYVLLPGTGDTADIYVTFKAVTKKFGSQRSAAF